MKKVIFFIIAMLSSVAAFGAQTMGIITDDDLRKVGVTQENIDYAKNMVDQVSLNYQKLLLEKKQLELEVNRYVLEGAEANLDKIDANFEKIGQIETQILKDRVRNQIKMQKYITQEQYTKARDIAIERINAERGIE